MTKKLFLIKYFKNYIYSRHRYKSKEVQFRNSRSINIFYIYYGFCFYHQLASKDVVNRLYEMYHFGMDEFPMNAKKWLNNLNHSNFSVMKEQHELVWLIQRHWKSINFLGKSLSEFLISWARLFETWAIAKVWSIKMDTKCK